MTTLFLHGWNSIPGGVKPTHLKDHGHTVINPKLPDDDFDEAVRIAQAEFDRHHPDVVVGSSRGGAVAMNINSGDARLALLCPAWKRWGKATTVRPGTVILHSRADDVIPFANSEELVRNSGLPMSALIETGSEHRLADPASLDRMLEACWDDRYHAIHESSHAVASLRRRLKPKRLAIGRTSMGTSGGIEFCSPAAVRRDPWRYLVICVSGCVGTRLFGYRNATVSKKLRRLNEGDEPGWMSDEMLVQEGDFSSDEIEKAEVEAQKLLKKNRGMVEALSEALIVKRMLEKEDIQSIFRSKFHRSDSATIG